MIDLLKMLIVLYFTNIIYVLYKLIDNSIRNQIIMFYTICDI